MLEVCSKVMLDLKKSAKYVQIGCDLCTALDRLMVVSTCVILTMFEHPQVFPSTSDLRWMAAEGSDRLRAAQYSLAQTHSNILKPLLLHAFAGRRENENQSPLSTLQTSVSSASLVSSLSNQ